MLMPSVVSAHDVTAAANAKARASFDILQAKAETDGDKVSFMMTTRGTAGAAHPDFNDKPLFEINDTRWHFHRVAPTKDSACGPAR